MNEIEIKELFFRLCLEKFQFLIGEFGFAVAAKHHGCFADSVLFENPTTAVEIGCDYRDRYLGVLLIRKVKGIIPPYEVSIAQDTLINSFYLDDLVTLREREAKQMRKPLSEYPSKEEFETVLTHYADSLKKYATDILRGDFSVFSQLNTIVKQRLG